MSSEQGQKDVPQFTYASAVRIQALQEAANAMCWHCRQGEGFTADGAYHQTEYGYPHCSALPIRDLLRREQGSD